jgi:molybdenum cofactor sulfurtransferase
MNIDINNKIFLNLINEFSYLDNNELDEKHDQQQTYLDHAGCTIPSKLMLKSIFNETLQTSPLVNPHSNPSSSIKINQIRNQILNHFNISCHQYDVIFTSGTTASLKLVGECFPFDDNNIFAYPSNAHTSLLGLRSYAKNCVCISNESLQQYVPNQPSNSAYNNNNNNNINQFEDIKEEKDKNLQCKIKRQESYNLLSVVGECNFSGSKLDLLNISKDIHKKKGLGWLNSALNCNNVKSSTSTENTNIDNNNHWLWLFDAAKLAGTSPIDISSIPFLDRPNFITISFYKIFGYPSGLGALIIRRDSSNILNKKYYGGGAIQMASAEVDYNLPKFEIHDRFEDGTIDFYGITALKHGFDYVNRVGGMKVIQQYTCGLSHYLVNKMMELKHKTGILLCNIYGKHMVNSGINNFNIQGPVITFNLNWNNGEVIGFNLVAELAELNNIIIRTGCFCNVGACSDHLKLTPEVMMKNFELGRNCGDNSIDIVDGITTGAIRVSLGASSNISDCNRLLEFLISNFLDKNNENKSTVSLNLNEDSNKYKTLTSGITDNKVEIKTSNNDNNNLKSNISSCSSLHLCQIFVYPIKSCGGILVKRWPMFSSGLYLDREFALMDKKMMTIISQKRFPKMSLLQPSVDIENGILTISVKKSSDESIQNEYIYCNKPLIISLDNIISNEGILFNKHSSNNDNLTELSPRFECSHNIRVCGRHCSGLEVSNDSNNWFSEFVGIECLLIKINRQISNSSSSDSSNTNDSGNISSNNNSDKIIENKVSLDSEDHSFSNDGQFLMISIESIQVLKMKLENEIKNNNNLEIIEPLISVNNFRPNFVMNSGGSIPHQEDFLHSFDIISNNENNNENKNNNNNNNENSSILSFNSVGPCTRCTMVNVNFKTGKRDNNELNILKTLGKYRRDGSNIYFGQFLKFSTKTFQKWKLDKNIPIFIESNSLIVPKDSIE